MATVHPIWAAAEVITRLAIQAAKATGPAAVRETSVRHKMSTTNVRSMNVTLTENRVQMLLVESVLPHNRCFRVVTSVPHFVMP
jgi:hypothetical protein